MYRLISLIIGYVCGNFLTAEVVSYKVPGNSSFDSGSKNPGMANMISLYGIKYGIIVLLGDLMKTFIPCLLCQYVLFPQYSITVAYAGLGVILGHNYPIWHKFVGGKGVTCTCGALICMSFGYGLLACVIGLIGVLISHYLPIGAIMIPLAFIIPAFYIYGKEAGIITIIMTFIMLSRHMPGLKNIPIGKEPRKDLIKMIKDKI